VPIELVVFDVAGTTVHDGDAVGGSFRAALAAAGLAVDPAAVKPVMGLPKPEAIHRLIEASPRAGELRGRVDGIHQDFVARMTRHYATSPEVRETPGATATFVMLRRAGIKVALNTGFSRDVLQTVLDRLGWEATGVLDATVASDEVPHGRPHPDMIQELMRRLGVGDAGRVAKVGDTPVDLQEGANAGCGLVIGVTNGTHTRPQLEPWQHTHLIASLEALPAVIGLTG
jgi:phosphonatase-like hydrolase